MRRLRLPLIAVVALLPTIAAAQMPPGQDRPGRPDVGSDRPARPVQAGQPGQPNGQPDRGGGWQGRDDRGPGPDGRPGGEDRFRHGDDRNGFRPGDPGRQSPGPGGYGGRQLGWDGRDGRPGGGPRDGYDRRPGWNDGRGGGGRDGFDGRPGGPGWNGRQGWDGRGAAGWRNDRRYDWRGWRDRNRGLFHGPRYIAPRGYGYRPFAVGYRLDPFFYGQAYWLADPYQYRLPPADGPYRWVRYFDDVLLVDLRTGTIADAINQFFW